MNAKVGSLNVDLTLETARFAQGLTKAQREMKQAGDRMEALGNRIGKSLKGLGIAAAAGGFTVFANAMQNAVAAGLEFASSLGEQAAQLGVSTDALQEYRYAATQAGLSSEEMDSALAKLTKTMGEALQGGKSQVEAFQRLGITLKDTEGNVLDAGAAIPKIADALQKVHNPAERAAILTDLFGRAGQKLEPLLAGGSAAVNNLRDAAHRLGIVLSSEQIQKADDTADKLAALKTVLSTNIAGAVADNSNAILALANALSQVVIFAGKAAQAFTRFKLAQGEFQANLIAKNPLYSSDMREAAAAGAERFRIARAQLDGNVDKTGSFRDYGAAPLFPKSNQLDPSMGAPVALPDVSSGSKGRPGRTGPTRAEVMSRIEDQLAGFANQALSEMQSLATSAGERAELELRAVELARVRTLREIATDEDINTLGKQEAAVQRERLNQQVERLTELERARIERDKQQQLESEAADLDRQAYDAKRDSLQMQASLADTDAERQSLALQQLDLEQQYQRQTLERIIQSDLRTDAERALAQQALDQLNANAPLARASVERSTETEGDAYIRNLNKTPAQMNEAFDQIKIDGLETLNDGLVDAIVNFRSLGDVASSVLKQILGDLLRLQIQQAIMGPLAGALGIGGGGGGAAVGIGKAALKMAAFADGTNFAPGGIALVGEKGPELVNLPRGSQVIPNHELAGMGGSQIHKPTFVFPGISNAKEAREAAGQAARRYRRELTPMRNVT